MVSKPKAAEQFVAVGRRKNSRARVRIMEGTGKFTVNGLDADAYFGRETAGIIIRMPLVTTGLGEKLDIHVKCESGGKSGQAGALRMGLARALCVMDAENRPTLAKAGLLTRDSRMLERKKYGLAGARRRFQFSKR